MARKSPQVRLLLVRLKPFACVQRAWPLLRTQRLHDALETVEAITWLINAGDLEDA